MGGCPARQSKRGVGGRPHPACTHHSRVKLDMNATHARLGGAACGSFVCAKGGSASLGRLPAIRSPCWLGQGEVAIQTCLVDVADIAYFSSYILHSSYLPAVCR